MALTLNRPNLAIRHSQTIFTGRSSGGSGEDGRLWLSNEEEEEDAIVVREGGEQGGGGGGCDMVASGGGDGG
ncbi:hypothetical protein Bca4012_089666 [Brassica carinata]|uniref:Uncharacterized protein n=1 Tax=Brassica carinata TaxID=52824 RepID=A0A8X7P716_BRACI|nr:hypothetical protein Bca52824_086832 [Brassica carinata]